MQVRRLTTCVRRHEVFSSAQAANFEAERRSYSATARAPGSEPPRVGGPVPRARPPTRLTATAIATTAAMAYSAQIRN
jgi:hypothetical protein